MLHDATLHAVNRIPQECWYLTGETLRDKLVHLFKPGVKMVHNLSHSFQQLGYYWSTSRTTKQSRRLYLMSDRHEFGQHSPHARQLKVQVQSKDHINLQCPHCQSQQTNADNVVDQICRQIHKMATKVQIKDE